MNRTSIVTKTLVAATLAASATAAQAVSFDLNTSFSGWLSSLQAIGSTTIGTGTFVATPGQPTVPVV